MTRAAREFLLAVLAIAVLAVCLPPAAGPRTAYAQRQAPTWIGPGPPGGSNTPTSTLVYPNILASWQVSQWYVDPQNAVSGGCASDSNATCTRNNCSTAGDGPCRTFTQIASRWTTYAPRLQQHTTITYLSSSNSNSDPLHFNGYFEKGGYLEITAAAGTTNCSGTLSGTTAKNRSTPQLLQETLCASAAPGQFVQNTTHASTAWTYKNVSGNTYSITQPLVNPTGPAQAPAEVNTWANSDNYTSTTPIAVDVSDLRPTMTDWNGGFSSWLWIHDLTVYDPAGSGSDPIRVGPWVNASNVRFQRYVLPEVAPADSKYYFTNCIFDGGIQGGSFAMGILQQYAAFGGYIYGGNSTLRQMYGWVLDGDIIVDGGGSPAFLENGEIGALYVASSNLKVGGNIFFDNSTPYGAAAVWGPGTLNTQGVARVAYPPGAGAAATTFLLSGGIQIVSTSKACLVVPSATSAYGTCNITLSASNLDSNLGATTGCLSTGEGSAYCNYGH